MNIAVIGANGREGRLITERLVQKGADVCAIVRSENKSAAQHVLQKDALDLSREDLAGFDAVVDALGTWTPETVDVIWKAEKHLADLLEGSSIRLVLVGGAGSLYTNPEHTQTLADGADFPDIYKPVAASHAKALADLRKRHSLNWTYISPAADFIPDGKETGRIIHAGEDFTVNQEGKSEISYADYASAFVQEVLHPSHNKERISFLAA